jgi:hypothetical protein
MEVVRQPQCAETGATGEEQGDQETDMWSVVEERMESAATGPNLTIPLARGACSGKTSSKSKVLGGRRSENENLPDTNTLWFDNIDPKTTHDVSTSNVILIKLADMKKGDNESLPTFWDRHFLSPEE